MSSDVFHSKMDSMSPFVLVFDFNLWDIVAELFGMLSRLCVWMKSSSHQIGRVYNWKDHRFERFFKSERSRNIILISMMIKFLVSLKVIVVKKDNFITDVNSATSKSGNCPTCEHDSKITILEGIKISRCVLWQRDKSNSCRELKISSIDEEEIENSIVTPNFIFQETIVIEMSHCSGKTWFTNCDWIR
jgi:hypothetical protein